MILEERESQVRSYCRSFPVSFVKAKDAWLYAQDGKRYIDFLAGAGALNYGHNAQPIKDAVMAYLEGDGIMHALDMYTQAKERFVRTFDERILEPRSLQYKYQFTGPTGTDAVEAALKLARKVTGRRGVFAFSGGYHGVSLGALATTSNANLRRGAGVGLAEVSFMPYPGGVLSDDLSLEYIRDRLTDSHSGVERPAAMILETLQAEGGINPAPVPWLRELASLCREFDILLICDEIQVGCYRTGPFFSFERAEITPDMVVLSKSVSGLGTPMSLVLLRPELDQWNPGEHCGTFRGNQLAFVAGAAALDYAHEIDLQSMVKDKGAWVERYLTQQVASLHPKLRIRGAGLIWGIDLGQLDEPPVGPVATRCFEQGLVIESAGRRGTVLKLLPPLTIDPAELERGCEIITHSLSEVLASRTRAVA